MDEVSKVEFLENFEAEFIGNDQDGYDYKGFFIKEDDLKNITKGIINNLEELQSLISNAEENEDEISELNNTIMAYIFGDGDEFQGSYEEEPESGDYCWYLDFGHIEIDYDKKGFNYKGVRFYKD